MDKGHLANYRFIINSQGVATLCKEEGATAHGLVWELTDACEAALDRYEGVRQKTYSKHEMSINLGSSSSECKCLIYLAQDEIEGNPRPGYLEAIVEAAKREKFDDSYLSYLRSWFRQES